MQLGPFKDVFKKTILKLWLFDFLADIVGGVLLFGITTIDHARYAEFVWRWDLSHAVSHPLLQQPLALLVVFLCFLLSAALVYLFSRQFSFQLLDISLRQKRRLSLVFAVFTAPYLLLLPATLFM